MTIICSNSAEKVIIGRGLFRGAICWINNPDIVGLILSANSIGDAFLTFCVVSTSSILFKSLIGILSANKDLSIDVNTLRGIIFGTDEDTNCGEDCDKLSNNACTSS